jgi:PhzF family phenazine biosynthesis protein
MIGTDGGASVSVDLVNVFTCEGKGGNPCPIVCDARGMSDAEMREVAQRYGHESGFVLPSADVDCDYSFRFWVPRHEMEMCGHATIGALWLLATKGRTAATRLRIATRSGAVTGFVARENGRISIEITQPAGRLRTLGNEESDAVLRVLRLSRSDLLDLPIQNAVTSRVKTLVPLSSLDRLNGLEPDYGAIEALCVAIGSTGLYPYAPHEGAHERTGQLFEARQFPKSSGYPEDAATGIAAAALAFGLLENGLVAQDATPIRVLQGRAMGRLSQINVRLDFAGTRAIGCLLGGDVTPA